jgi:hypothetical protein
MGDKDWGEEDIKEFARLVENSEKTWKPASEELEVINLGTEQDKKELKIGTFSIVEKKEGPISLLHEHVYFFSWIYTDMSGLDTIIVVHKIPLVY